MKFTLFAPIFLAALAACAPLSDLQKREIDPSNTGNDLVNDFKDFCATASNKEDSKCKKYLVSVPNFEADVSKPMPVVAKVIPPIARPMVLPVA